MDAGPTMLLRHPCLATLRSASRCHAPLAEYRSPPTKSVSNSREHEAAGTAVVPLIMPGAAAADQPVPFLRKQQPGACGRRSWQFSAAAKVQACRRDGG